MNEEFKNFVDFLLPNLLCDYKKCDKHKKCFTANFNYHRYGIAKEINFIFEALNVPFCTIQELCDRYL